MTIVARPTAGKIFKNIGLDIKKNSIKKLQIDNVLLNIKSRTIKIYFKSSEIVDYSDIDYIKKQFKKNLAEFECIELKVNYDSSLIEDLNVLVKENWNNILYIINKNIPSSRSWIEDLKWSFNNNIFKIDVRNNYGFFKLKEKKIDNLIADFFCKEFGVKIGVKIEKKQSEDIKLDYDKIKEAEEKKIIKKLESIQVQDTKRNDQYENSNNKKYSGNAVGIVYGKAVDEEVVPISSINTNSGQVTIEGEVFDIESRDIKGNKKLYIYKVTDYTSSLVVKLFATKKQQESLEGRIKERSNLKIKGDIVFDSFSRELVMMTKAISITKKIERVDKSEDKRVELHLHTKMSDMDGMSSIDDMAKKLSQWGHKAMTITDHGVVQSFPEGMDAGKKYGLKMIYGLEGYVVNDSNPVVLFDKGQDIDCEYVVFDIETTGFSPINNKITEIGAVKIKNNEIVDKFSKLVNPGVKIPEKIVKLTGITDNMVLSEPKIEDILPEFYEFIGDAVLVAHNAQFDMGFITKNFSDIGINIDNTVLDTLQLARDLFPKLKRHKLNVVAKHLNISLENHHRAVDDSYATAEILLKCLDMVSERGVNKLYQLNTLSVEGQNYKSSESFHIILLAKNYKGLKNLYKLVSESHINYFYRKPRIPKSILNRYREGLILGTACEAGELYRAILKNKGFNEIRDIVNYYDYLEIQPVGNNRFLVDKGMVKDVDELRNINKKIVSLGEKFNKPVIATGDVHFLDPQDEVFRKILMAGKGFEDSDNQPPLYLKTTEEMLNEFAYLGKEKAREVVITNTNAIADSIEELLPIPDGTFPPKIEGAEEELREITYKKARKIYGEVLPEIVETRLEKELSSIIQNGYAVMYIIAQKLVKKSLEDGYLVGSRGSVGSSFVATMSDITEVNPLPPHYVCPNCKNSDFIIDGSVGSGVDMEDKYCPVCQTKYIKDGHDIPFEVFLGFEGDKEPDIDLNFAGEYQPNAHQYTEELFGKGHVFRAGTIGTIADKTAYGFVKKYFDEKEMVLNSAEATRLVKGCTGIKRTSGQHPGGVMIVPGDKEIYDFSPIQYPANDKNSGVITTHFDYHSISGRILKLDILGHDTPTIIKMLEDLTGVDAQEIPLDDNKTMSLFTSTEVLGIDKEEINSEVGSFGIPEFGTKFVRQMLLDTKPTTFAELVRISGLSHGTDVWLNNAQDLVRNGVTKLSEVISTRDDIMMYLIYNGLEKKRSFTIMEKVRKGKGLTEEDEKYMRDMKIPDWYIQSCKKIKYMFPKAHAVAYVMMSFRIAYFKVHYPEAFYATYFSMKAVDFDAELIVKGKDVVKNKIEELENMGNEKTAKEKNLLTVLEVALEMYCRGFKFDRVNIYKSDSDKFLIGEQGIIPPLKSLQGVGENAARSIAKEREKGKFLSIEDLTKRAKINKTAVEALKVHGCLKGLPESNQLSLFNI